MERKKNVAEIKRLIQEKRGQGLALHHLIRFLHMKGISKPIAEEIAYSSAGSQGEIHSLQEMLAAKIRISKKSPLLPKTLALVGASGSGKTTAILRLARYFATQGKRVAIQTIEGEKLKAQVLKCLLHATPLIKCYEKEEEIKEYDVLLVDTPGCTFYDEKKIDWIGEKLALLSDPEVLLTINLASKEEDLYAILHQFSILTPTKLLATKLDETLTPGILINVLTKTDLPVSFVSYGSEGEGTIKLADPLFITHKILTHYNQEKYQLLRQLAMS